MSEPLKSTPIYKGGPVPYRYALWHLPEEDAYFPYLACRENMKLEDGTWVVVCRYWCAYRKSLIEADKEYQHRVASEGKKLLIEQENDNEGLSEEREDEHR